MPSPERVLSADDAARIVMDRGFVPAHATTLRRVGIEMEWCTVRLGEPSRPPDLAEVRAAAARATLPHGSAISYEPGGQIELSSAALPGLGAVGALAADARVLGGALAEAGIGMAAIGLEPGPRRERRLRSPRYDAMEAHFDASGEAGRTMMCSTAALHVNLDLGDPDVDDEISRRWDLLHALGPLLAAMFANSPFWDLAPSGWRSTRLAVWNAIDAHRTSPVAVGGACREAWARYAMDADVILVRRTDTDHRPVPPGLSFGEWIAQGHETGWPTVEDLEYHLTTLFPPVRPRGWFELRVMDALPMPWWQVAAAVATVLVDDPRAAECARNAVTPVRDQWSDAARHGLTDPAFARAARTCMQAARAVLRSHGADDALIDAAAEFDERFVSRGRTPADDLLDAYTRDHTVPLPLDNV